MDTKANEIAFRRVAVSLDLSRLPPASSTSDRPVRLPPASSTVVPVTVVTTVRNVGPHLLGILQSGSLAYQIHGTVSQGDALGLTLPFNPLEAVEPVGQWPGTGEQCHGCDAEQVLVRGAAKPVASMIRACLIQAGS